MSIVAAVIVAAGSSSRLGQPKQLLSIQGEPMLQRVTRLVIEAGASPVCVVLGANREVIESRVDLKIATIVVNDGWQEGMASSIRAGVRAAERETSEASGLLLVICDQPRVTADHLRKLISTFSAHSAKAAIASVYAGTRGIPAIFPRFAFADLCALQGDKGARALLAQPSWPVVEVMLEAGEVDIDRPEDLDKIQ